VDEQGEIEFDLIWENSRGEFECEKFAGLEAEVQAEWESEFKEQFLQEQEQSQEREKANERQADRRPQREKGVKLEDRQFEKEWGAFRPVGFYRQRKEIFICGNCSHELKGSLRHGKVKNRNNPLFWGLNISEKVLCGNCLEKRKGEMSPKRRAKFAEYRKLGMFA
jgi:hypothetical protein